MKPVVIITIIFLSSFVVFDSSAQSSEESLGLSVLNMTSYIFTALVMLIIPTLIILLVLKRKGKLTSSTLKKILIGIGLSFLGLVILGVAGSMSMSDEENAELDRQKRLEEQKQKQIELLEEQKQKQIELPKETVEIEQEKFDPLVVKSAKKNIPEMQSLPKEVLKQCKAVRSFSDYEIFSLAIVVMSVELTETINGINYALTLLENQGYNKHPEVGPLIRETRSLALETGMCIDELVSKYGN